LNARGRIHLNVRGRCSSHWVGKMDFSDGWSAQGAGRNRQRCVFQLDRAPAAARRRLTHLDDREIGFPSEWM
jgi:hypothetical protein